MGGLFYSLFFYHGFKRAFYRNVCAIFTYFGEKNYSKWIIFERFSILGNSRFFLDEIWDIPMTFTDIVLGPSTFKTGKIVAAHTYLTTKGSMITLFDCADF